MRETYLISAAAVLLMTGCTGNSESSRAGEYAPETSAVVTTTETAVSTSSNSKAVPEPEEKKFITAEVTGYKDYMLTYIYEGKEYELYFDRNKFKNETRTQCTYESNVSEMIINNKLGEKITAQLTMNSDMTKILSCDVINPNGNFKEQMVHFERDGTFNEGKLYSFKRKGSMCTISNDYETLDFDLNTLMVFFKFDYPESIFPVHFSYYEFPDGKRILLTLDYDLEIKDNNVVASDKYENLRRFDSRTCFYGVVQSYNEQSEKAVILLNDKKTLCTVPTYYNDGGELKEGAEIMVTLMTDTSLFGSGGSHEFDYAVISTDPDYYLTAEEYRDFDTLAYAYYTNASIFKLKRKSITQAEMEMSER